MSTSTWGKSVQQHIQSQRRLTQNTIAEAAGLSSGYMSSTLSGHGAVPLRGRRFAIYQALELSAAQVEELEKLSEQERCPHCDEKKRARK